MAPSNEPPPPSMDELKSRLTPFCERHGVARLELFGSRPLGDLLVTFRPVVDPGWNLFELHKDLEELLGCPVDLLTRSSVELDRNAVRRQAILESVREIYATQSSGTL